MKRQILGLLLWACTSLTFGVQGIAGPYRVDLRSEPGVIPVGKARLIIRLTDAQTKAVPGATIRVLAKMPGMSMGEKEVTAAPTDVPGTYSAPAVFAMAGSYDTSIAIEGSLGSGKTIVQLATGVNPAGEASSKGPWLALVGALGLAGFILWRMRKTGQKLNSKGIFTGSTLVSLAVLGLALVAAVWAVNRFRREGSMTPLEAQVMEMNTPAPEGSIPVQLAVAETKPFSASVSYSGQVVGYVEQDVIARVTGSIRSMSVYVGDRVRVGQVLARLETSQLQPMVAEKSAGVNSASQGVTVATSELEQSLNMVQQVNAEVSMSRSEVEETQSMLESARASQGAAEANLQAAKAEASSAQSDLSAAAADATYQRQELERMRSLFEQAAVSKDEYQRAVAETQKADAASASARDRITQAGAMVNAATSEVRKAAAEASAAANRVSKARSALTAKLAQVRTAKSAVETARAKVGQSRASVAEAAAGLKGAATQRGYAELKSEIDGVVTQRLIAPGTVVNAGQSVLKLAQVSPVRVQANVPQQDLARIQVGALVFVRSVTGGTKPLELKVTSVAPAVDPASRTGIVEAIYENASGDFAPGQFVSLDIQVGDATPAVVVPTAAIQVEKQRAYIWVASASTGGELTVTRQEVEVSARSGGFAAIRSGLKSGQRVVLSPEGLTVGDKVTSREEESPLSPDAPITIEVNESGYVPSSITLPSGKAATLIFIRKVESTCATSVDFPELRISADTPLNEPVTVNIPAQSSGKELSFACPMKMYKGKVIIK